MKLVYPDYKHQIVFQEDRAEVFILENPMEYRRLVEELHLQCQGEDGRFVLSEEEKILKIQDNMEMIFNPFQLEINSRKVIERVYKDLIKEMNCGEEYKGICDGILELHTVLQHVMNAFPYELDSHSVVDEKMLLKAFDVKVCEQWESFVEKLTEYIKVHAQVLGVKIFVLVQASSYLTEQELEQIVAFAKYNKIQILFIEASCLENLLPNENRYIIDKDCCEIYKDM